MSSGKQHGCQHWDKQTSPSAFQCKQNSLLLFCSNFLWKQIAFLTSTGVGTGYLPSSPLSHNYKHVTDNLLLMAHGSKIFKQIEVRKCGWQPGFYSLPVLDICFSLYSQSLQAYSKRIKV